MSGQPPNPVPLAETLDRVERLMRMAYANRRFWADASFRRLIWAKIGHVLDAIEAEVDRTTEEHAPNDE